MQFVRFDTIYQSLVIACPKTHMAQVAYWGTALPKNVDLKNLYHTTGPDIPSCAFDIAVRTSVLPTDGGGFFGMPAVSVRNIQGQVLYPEFQFDTITTQENNTHIIYTDTPHGLTYTMCIKPYDGANVFAVSAHMHSTDKIVIDWFSAPVLPLPSDSEYMIDFSGRWCSEMQPNKVPWHMGIHMRESRLGRSSHEHYPAVIVPTTGATELSGGVYGLHYGWSGGHRMIAEHTQKGTRHIQFGHASGSYHTADTEFKTAPLYITYTDTGINGMSQSFHKLVRNTFMNEDFRTTPRPVNYNCWEAVYFDHNIQHLQHIADKVHALGAERFVLDDGWFGTRNDSSSSLGDWHINTEKFPHGFSPLIDYINNLGMQFGIWFEPEMVSPDSTLARTHPDWVLGNHTQPTFRQQWVLNMGLSAVQQYLYDKISYILSTYNVSYIKWDHNRTVPQVRAAQTEGTYSLLHRLKRNFPRVEIESCCSGGGRMDYGILPYTERVWLSDCNDAYERLVIQYNGSMFLPHDIVGSHVGPRTSHTTGRVIPMHFRAWVSALRHMGFEMSPDELTAEETAVLTKAVNWYKQNREWIFKGRVYRLPVQQHVLYPEMIISQDQQQFVLSVGQFGMLQTVAPFPLKLIGLEADATYKVRFENKDDLPWVAGRKRCSALYQGTVTATGAELMQMGVTLPISDPGTMMVFKGNKVL